MIPEHKAVVHRVQLPVATHEGFGHLRGETGRRPSCNAVAGTLEITPSVMATKRSEYLTRGGTVLFYVLSKIKGRGD